MKRKTEKKTEMIFGDNYQIFLGLIDKMDEFENEENHFWFFKNLSGAEIALLNGYIVNSGNYEQFHLNQTLDLHSLEVVQNGEQEKIHRSNHPIHDLAFYCMGLDRQNRLNFVS